MPWTIKVEEGEVSAATAFVDRDGCSVCALDNSEASGRLSTDHDQWRAPVVRVGTEVDPQLSGLLDAEIVWAFDLAPAADPSQPEVASVELSGGEFDRDWLVGPGNSETVERSRPIGLKRRSEMHSGVPSRDSSDLGPEAKPFQQ